MSQVRRIFVEKKTGFDVEARSLAKDLKESLNLTGLQGVRLINRYDVAGITDEEYKQAREIIFAEPTVDYVYDETLPVDAGCRVFAMEYLPGQYDQRADSAAQCIQILTQKERPLIQSAKVIILVGLVTDEEFAKIKSYCINPVDSRDAALEKPMELGIQCTVPSDVALVEGFMAMSGDDLEDLMGRMGFAMSFEDLKFLQAYFRDTEKRNPTVTELRVIDTYWSDHCRHTTFLTEILDVQIDNGTYAQPIKDAYQEYLQSRAYVYGERKKDICLMDIATIGMKQLRKKGLLSDLDESEEINACSIVVDVDVDGTTEQWLVMFKNETHNHPTEIEPFGGAATCLGGAIRDPLSGRSYVYQAMRVTGSGDPRTTVADTLAGKLPQKKITTEAAHGYSSYGNQIGLATGQVTEVYDEGFVAKRMEIGAVIAAAPKNNVVREVPQPGDVVILVGGRTGRDGCGGATGSSKEHNEDSILTCGAEVQKGNPPEERKIQRLFRNPEVSTMIKRCNDFGAGGVSVAIGELTDGLVINLDAVPKKYDGLDGTELAISESQERMAVVVSPQNAQRFVDFARAENMEATLVAEVTDSGRLQMLWRGKTIVDVSREFLNTNGVKQSTEVAVAAPGEMGNCLQQLPASIREQAADLHQAWLGNLQDLNVCSQKGLVEKFDSTIGAGTVLMPFGGKYQATPAEGMVAKLPVLHGETTTGTVMTHGYNPQVAKWSPFHGALLAVVEAVTRVVAVGGDYRKVRLTLQEYFEKLGQEASKWGKPFSALLGAYHAQTKLGIPAIGGKDSMSGTFKELNVPPTLVAFAVAPVEVTKVVSNEFKKVGSKVVLIKAKYNEDNTPDFEGLQQNYLKVSELIGAGKVLAASTIKIGGLAAALSKMCFGNKIGVRLEGNYTLDELFLPHYGSFILELDGSVDLSQALGSVAYQELGQTQAEPAIDVNWVKILLDEAVGVWTNTLERVFPTQAGEIKGQPEDAIFAGRSEKHPIVKVARPKVVIPVFPGTNCEYDSARAFEKAGGEAKTIVIRNLSASEIEQSIEEMVKAINESQIIMIPGGFSAGDEPDGSGKFIATFFRNPRVKDAVMDLLQRRDGLMLGICNGFQALIKLGLVPYGEIRDITEDCPTLTYNTIGRHASCLVRTKIVSTLSPWFNNVTAGELHTIAVSHGEGRFVGSEEEIARLFSNGQVATQYVDLQGQPTYDIAYNPNGSMQAIEGITSPDGRILGKMGHSERIGTNVYKNVPGEKDQQIFAAGVKYFQ